METVNSQQSQSQPRSGFGTLWRKLKVLLITSSLFGLISLNILTTVNDNIHSAMYHGIEAILSSMVSNAALSQMLNNSPTVKKRKDIAVATKALTDEKTRLTAANKSLEKKHALLEKSHKEITAKHANLEKSHKEISTKHEGLKRTLVTQATTAQKVSKQVAARSLANATRNVSSMAGEAIPGVGLSLIVIVTGWDIYDACQTMKDMNTLNSAYFYAPVNTYSPKAQLINIPEINSEAEAEIGQTIVSKAYRRVYPAISLPDEIIEGRPASMGKLRIHAGILYLYTEDENGKYYRDPKAEWGSDFSGWQPWVGGIFVPRDTTKKPVNFMKNPALGLHLGEIPSEGITYTTYEEWDTNSFKRELVYSGVSQNTISILYREFKHDIARPAFSQELKYDLAQGNEIGFRGARFLVLKAGNTSIRYKVLRALD